MAAHSSVLAWRVPGMGEPGGLPSMGLCRVGHDWIDLAAAAAASFQFGILSLSYAVILEKTFQNSSKLEFINSLIIIRTLEAFFNTFLKMVVMDNSRLKYLAHPLFCVVYKLLRISIIFGGRFFSVTFFKYCFSGSQNNIGSFILTPLVYSLLSFINSRGFLLLLISF